MKIIERNLQEIGKSLLVTLPKGWTTNLKLKKGSKIKMNLADNGTIIISPEFVFNEETKTAVIKFDEYYARRFFKEYFEGNERIVFTLSTKISDVDRKKIYSFLQKFMNAQVIEETSEKITVKCFKINELSIQECLNRMYHLSMSMFDELVGQDVNCDKSKLSEMDDTITRFYYMLVMQVRRYLEEGKYIDNDQISLLLAMDYRMIAEKIERIADILKTYGVIKDKKLLDLLNTIKKYYSKSFYAFINKNYDAALELMVEYQKIIDSLKLIRENSKTAEKYIEYNNAIMILSYSKEISMLIR